MKLVKTNLLNNFGIDEEVSGYEDDMDVEDEGDDEDEDEEDEDDEDEDQMGNLINIKNYLKMVLIMYLISLQCFKILSTTLPSYHRKSKGNEITMIRIGRDLLKFLI